MVREAAEKEMAVGSEASGRGLETVSLAWFLPGTFSGDLSFCFPWSQSAGALGKGRRWRSTSESGTSGFLLQHTRSSPTWHTTERYPEHRYLQQAIKSLPNKVSFLFKWPRTLLHSFSFLCTLLAAWQAIQTSRGKTETWVETHSGRDWTHNLHHPQGVH